MKPDSPLVDLQLKNIFSKVLDRIKNYDKTNPGFFSPANRYLDHDLKKRVLKKSVFQELCNQFCELYTKSPDAQLPRYQKIATDILSKLSMENYDKLMKGLKSHNTYDFFAKDLKINLADIKKGKRDLIKLDKLISSGTVRRS